MAEHSASGQQPVSPGAGDTGALVIRGGTLYTATDSARADILVRGETIHQIAARIDPPPGARIVEADGLEIFPGGIDAHTHFDLPFMGTTTADDFESGTAAAACGGTTTIIDFAIPAKGGSLLDGLAAWEKKADGKCAVDYAFHMCLVDFNEAIAAEIPEVVRRGITSFKCFMAYKGTFMIDDAQLIEAMKTAAGNRALVSVHAENGDMLAYLMKHLAAEGKTEPRYHPVAHPAEAEGEAVHRAVVLARMAGSALYIVHMSTVLALEEVRAARTRGEPVLAETCPQYLLLSDELYLKEGFEGAKWVMSPPLRSRDNHDKLWLGLRDGTIQCVATDHCSFNFKGQKEMGLGSFTTIPNGIPAVEDRVILLYSHGVARGRISRNRFVDLIATQPAKIFGLYPEKGTIAVGSDADFVLIDPRRQGKVTKEKQHMRADYSAFEGIELRGGVDTVISRGRVVFRQGAYTGEKGRGRYLARKPFVAGEWGRHEERS